MVVKPCFGLRCELSTSFTRYWRERPALDIGHRGVGDTHKDDFNNITATRLDSRLCILDPGALVRW